ncbi:MAG: biopolymer transporter ExbD [Deferribacteres bacterium]|nr:biopolymer transporter ExbD [candidate division KSB1 bacterium]MCB9508585.1 biopolymer transporter ExbD [Deferribacteres bacterium]
MFYSTSKDHSLTTGIKKKKRRTGLVLRLVDVIFILLFGFIIISEVERKSVIKLAKSKTTLPDIPDKEVVVFIGVLANGQYLIEKETQVVDNLLDLEHYLDIQMQFFADQNLQMRVRIRANFDAPVKYTFPVVGACRERGIPVGVDVIKKGRRG